MRDEHAKRIDRYAESGAADRDHNNPIDVTDITNEERARMLLDYLDAFRAEFGRTPKLMPLNSEGKAPWITGRCSLDSAEADAALVDGYEAARQIHHDGARGFAIYAGRPEHGTEGVAFIDHDDLKAFPAPTADPTLEVLSGSGRGPHETYRNDAEDPVRNAHIGTDDGEVRAENWYVVVPGSVHPSGGVYHVVEDRVIASIADADLTDDMRPSTGRPADVDDETVERRRRAQAALASETSGESTVPIDEGIQTRLDLALDRDDVLDDLYHARPPTYSHDDRSASENRLAWRLAFWFASDRSAVRWALDRSRAAKWHARDDDSYRKSILAAVDRQTEFYNPDRTPEADGPSATNAREPVSVLPLAQLSALNPIERRRAARKRGLEWPTTDDLRNLLRERTLDAVRNEEDVVIPAPTSSGKSFTVATEEWRELNDITHDAPVVHLHETCEARDSAVEDTREHGGEGTVLRGRREACPVARGDHDPDETDDDQTITIDGCPASIWLDEVCDDRNVPFSAAHAHLDEHNDQRAPLPCCPPIDDSPDASRQLCPAVSQWQGVPRDDDGEPAYDVVHATHPFAHVPGLIRGSSLFIDEQPDFTVELSQDRIRRTIAAYLDEIDAPVSTFEAFISLARLDDSAWRTDAGREAAELANALDSRSPSHGWYLTDRDAHTLAPAIARALWYALRDEPNANGRLSATVAHEPPRLDASTHDEDGWNREWVTVVVDENNDIRQVRAAPDLSGARCVIGLDAHPTPSLWQLNTRPNIQVDPLLDPEERRLWRRFERGLTVVQVGDKTRPAGKNGKYAKRDRGREPFIHHLGEYFGTEFATAITDSHSENQLTDLMLDAGVPADRIGTMHFGEEKSRNDFAGESVGAVLGCIDAGDDYVLDALAELGLNAAPETDTDEDGEEFRAYGRGFTGPDADTANALVASVRENHVAQAAGRYARNADDPNDTATVFVRTDALPVGGADYQVPGVEHVTGEKQRAVAEAAREHPGSTASELRDLVSERLPGDGTVSKRHVTNTLASLLERGVMRRRRKAGAYGGDTWHADGLTDAAVAGDVDLGDAIANSPSWNTIEYQFVIHDLSASSPRSSAADRRRLHASEPVAREDRPPDAPG